tara:strand:- start:1619 stop:2989 length:1371 start_codon:yes stop_codon:yes gene_type:complete
MFRPSIQKTRILVFLALINIIVYYFVSSSVVTFRASDYELKIASAEKMENALNVLKKYGRKYPFLSRDPFDTRLVFLNTETSPLLTDIGKYEAKSTVLKPNFSALIIDQFSKSGLNKGDTIAVSMTGSMPGANIAVLMACEAMELEYILISSLGASSWGATDMNLSWPKMEKILYDNNLISKVSDKFTYGGGADYLKRGTRYRKIYGGESKRVSIDSLMISLYPNKTMDDLFILHGLSNDEVLNDSTGTILKTSINQRISFYEKSCSDGSLSCFDAYVNVGGGVASFGYKGKNKLKDNFGYVKANDVLDILPSFEKRNSVMAKFAESNIPLINITEIEKLIKGTDIGYFNSPIIAELDQIGNGKWDKEGFKWSQNLNGSPEVFVDLNQNSIWDEGEEYLDQDGLLDIGKGNLYNTKKFNMIVVWFGLMICLGSTIYIGFVSYQQISRQMRSYDPNS